MGTKSLSCEDVKQLVGLDECVCFPLPNNIQGQVCVCVCVCVQHLCHVLHIHTCPCMNDLCLWSVPQFNTRVKKTACFDHLVQANVRNKKLLKDAVQNITAKGITNYTKGFEFAFEQLSAVRFSSFLFLFMKKHVILSHLSVMSVLNECYLSCIHIVNCSRALSFTAICWLNVLPRLNWTDNERNTRLLQMNDHTETQSIGSGFV